ncbi:MAG: DHH family phosphoesterase [Lachnospiraceae bacterium]|nr:DHH family phosphoesterase [Lachnospiraceae bacterium]
MDDRFDSLAELVKGHRVIIQTHDFPDPDAIATACGLHELLKWRGIDSEICYYGRIEKTNTKMAAGILDVPIYNAEELTDVTTEDYVITVDGQKDNSNFTDLKGTEVACIDHHPFVTTYQYRFLFHRIVGACASMITEWIKESGMPVSADLATLLLYGIKMDTRNFSAGVTHCDITAFDFLIEKADMSKIHRLENSALDLSDLRAYGAAIENIAIYDNVGFAYIPFECPDGLIAAVSEFILSLSSVRVSVVYANRSGGLKFSVRSENGKINAGRLLHTALKDIGNGGGHATMAGGVIYPEFKSQFMDRHQTETIIRNRIMQVYRVMMEDA